MLEVSLIIIVSIALLTLTIISIILIVKHLNFMHDFLEEIHKNQVLLHKEILEIKNISPPSKNIKQSIHNMEEKNKTKETKVNKDRIDLKSSKVSKEELSKLMEGKELVFSKQVTASTGEMFINTDIDI